MSRRVRRPKCPRLARTQSSPLSEFRSIRRSPRRRPSARAQPQRTHQTAEIGGLVLDPRNASPEPAGTCFSALVGRGMAMCASRRLVRVASAVLLVLLMAGVGALAGGAADHVRLVAAGGACNRTRLAPPTSRTQSELSAVASVSPREAWAVGWQGAAGDIPLVEHFDGQAWREVTVLPVRRGDDLYGIAAVSARDVWVLGTTQPGVNSFVLRWDGAIGDGGRCR